LEIVAILVGFATHTTGRGTVRLVYVLHAMRYNVLAVE